MSFVDVIFHRPMDLALSSPCLRSRCPINIEKTLVGGGPKAVEEVFYA